MATVDLGINLKPCVGDYVYCDGQGGGFISRYRLENKRLIGFIQSIEKNKIKISMGAQDEIHS